MWFEVERSKALTVHYYLPSLFSLTCRGVPIMETRESVCLANHVTSSPPDTMPQAIHVHEETQIACVKQSSAPMSLFSHLETSMDTITGKQVGVSAFHQDSNIHAIINFVWAYSSRDPSLRSGRLSALSLWWTRWMAMSEMHGRENCSDHGHRAKDKEEEAMVPLWTNKLITSCKFLFLKVPPLSLVLHWGPRFFLYMVSKTQQSCCIATVINIKRGKPGISQLNPAPWGSILKCGGWRTLVPHYKSQKPVKSAWLLEIPKSSRAIHIAEVIHSWIVF